MNEVVAEAAAGVDVDCAAAVDRNSINTSRSTALAARLATIGV